MGGRIVGVEALVFEGNGEPVGRILLLCAFWGPWRLVESLVKPRRYSRASVGKHDVGRVRRVLLE